MGAEEEEELRRRGCACVWAPARPLACLPACLRAYEAIAGLVCASVAWVALAQTVQALLPCVSYCFLRSFALASHPGLARLPFLPRCCSVSVAFWAAVILVLRRRAAVIPSLCAVLVSAWWASTLACSGVCCGASVRREVHVCMCVRERE